MGETTHISWTDATFNPWIGCTEVSNGPKGACVGCYARELAARYGFAKWGNEPRHRTSEANWKKPLAWNRKAARDGARPFVFCASLADVFDNQVDPAWRADLFDLIRITPHLTWLLLTKRPQNIVKLFEEAVDKHVALRMEGWPRNAAIGCTVVTQAEADRDIPILLAAKAALRPAFAFVSMEPLMEAVDLTRVDPRTNGDRGTIWTNVLAGYTVEAADRDDFADVDILEEDFERLDWVITGGETDQGKHKARPSDTEWYRALRDQCSAAGVPFHMKQMTRKAPIPADLQIQDRPVISALDGPTRPPDSLSPLGAT